MNNPSLSRKYIDHVSTTPRSLADDPIVVTYNNIYGMTTDTRMTMTEGGVYIITGHMIGTPKWEQFICQRFWGGVDLKEPLLCFLDKYGYQAMPSDYLNGDHVVPITPKLTKDDSCGTCCSLECPCCYTTCESKIPKNIIDITTDKDINHVKECFKDSKTFVSVAEKLNDSLYIKGNNWYAASGHIYGIFNDDVIIL